MTPNIRKMLIHFFQNMFLGFGFIFLKKTECLFSFLINVFLQFDYGQCYQWVYTILQQVLLRINKSYICRSKHNINKEAFPSSTKFVSLKNKARRFKGKGFSCSFYTEMDMVVLFCVWPSNLRQLACYFWNPVSLHCNFHKLFYS